MQKIRNMRVVSDDPSLLHLNCFNPASIGKIEIIDGKKYRVIDNSQMTIVTYEPVEDAEPVKTLHFVGIDGWNRPVFKNTEAPEYYGSVHELFSYEADENEVLAKISENDLCYFGSRFDCEPYGTPAGNIKIERKGAPAKS